MSTTQRNDGQISRSWRKPCEGWVKCNTDATIFEHKGYTGYGCVIRDANGKMVAVKNGLLRGVLNPALAKAVSYKEALSWVETLGINKE